MIDSTTPPLLLASQARVVAADRALQRRAERGELFRIRPGVYIDAGIWNAMKHDARYRARVHAAAATLQPGTQFSHDSAAALWHLPSIGAWPQEIHVVAQTSVGGRSSRGIARHTLGLDPAPVVIDRATVTSLARTVVDAARFTSFLRAVAMADAALAPAEEGTFRAENGVPPVSKADLEAILASSRQPQGTARARAVLQFATGASGSVGESLSRVQFHLMGFPQPELQVPFFDADGFIGYVDFYWPELDLIGEFDGIVKYMGKRYRRGQLPEDVVLAEKQREDRLRRVARDLVRWDWTVASNQRLLAQRVRPHGLLPLR